MASGRKAGAVRANWPCPGRQPLSAARPAQGTLGRSLLPVMRAIKSWAECHMDDVRAARHAYDTTTATDRA